MTELDVRHRHQQLTNTAPRSLEVAGRTYDLRKFTPKRKGEPVGHGWVRRIDPFHRAEVGAEAVNLIDEIVVLRAELAKLHAGLQTWKRETAALDRGSHVDDDLAALVPIIEDDRVPPGRVLVIADGEHVATIHMEENQ